MTDRTLARLEQELISGIHPDFPNALVPLWAAGTDIVFEANGPRPVQGVRQAAKIPDIIPIRFVLQHAHPNPSAFIANRKHIYRVTNIDWRQLSVAVLEELSQKDINLNSIYDTDYWWMTAWGSWVLATNGVDPIQIWKPGQAAFENLAHTGVGEKNELINGAKILLPFKQYMVAFKGQTVYSSHADDVEDWETRRNNEAVELPIRDIETDIKAAVSHPRGIVFYGANSAHLLTYEDPPYFIGTRRLVSGIGAFGPQSVVNIDGVHFGIGVQGIWQFSPAEGFSLIDTPSIRRYVFDNLDMEQAHKCVAWYDEWQNLLMFSYPTKSTRLIENENSVGYSLATKAWSPMRFAATAASQTSAFSKVLVGEVQGSIFWHGVEDGATLAFGDSRFLEVAALHFLGGGYGVLSYGTDGYGGFGGALEPFPDLFVTQDNSSFVVVEDEVFLSGGY